MNKDTVKGTIDDVAGRVKRQTGEWTGNVDKQVEGAGQQVKGKAEKAWGNIKDSVKDAAHSHDQGKDADHGGSTIDDRTRKDQSPSGNRSR